MEMVSWGGMDIHSPSSYISRSDWMNADINSKNGNWTMEENKMFENGLAVYDKDTPDRWEKIVKLIPGKSLEQVKTHYSYLQQDVTNIEAGLIPVTGYTTTPYNSYNTYNTYNTYNNYNTYNSNITSPPFTLDWVNSRGASAVAGGSGGSFQYNPAELHHCSSSSITTTTTTSTATYGVVKRHGGRVCSDHERKKGVPWTEEEHRLFLLGLKKYGKGDWRNISRNYVISRTPTQVASHAQKYFIRLSSGGKDKRRSSIHDITTVNLPDNSRPALPPPTTTTRTTTSLPSKQCAEKTAVNSNHHCKESAAETGAFFNSSAHHHHHHHQSGIASTAPQPY